MGLRGGAGVKNCCPIGRGGLAAAAAAGPMKLGGRGAAYTPGKGPKKDEITTSARGLLSS